MEVQIVGLDLGRLIRFYIGLMAREITKVDRPIEEHGQIVTEGI